MLASHRNSYRTIPSGSIYVAPPKTDAVNPFTIGDEALFALLRQRRVKLSKMFPNVQFGARYVSRIGQAT